MTPASMRGLTNLMGVSPNDVPYSQEELMTAHAAQQADAMDRARQGEAANLAALGPMGAYVNAQDRMSQQAANAMEGLPMRTALDMWSAAPYAAAERGFDFKALPSRVAPPSTRSLGGS